MEAPMAATAAALILLRDALTSLFVLADASLVFLSSRSKPLRLLRSFLLSSFLFLLRLLPSYLDFVPAPAAKHAVPSHPPPLHSAITHLPSPSPPPLLASSGDSGISRALSQLLVIVNNLPVSSRKYEAVRSIAEHVIDENRRGGSKALIEVNRVVLSSAFSRTLGQLEAAMVEMERDGRGTIATGGYQVSNFLPGDDTAGGKGYGGGKVLRAAGDVVRWGLRQLRGGKCEGGSGGIIARLEGSGSCAEKLAAELIWLGHKLVESGCAEEAVGRWASATNLAWLAITAPLRLQGSIVKVSAFLFKQAKEISTADETKKEQLRLMRMKMLMSWLPLLCRASNGTDTPVLSLDERAELERVLDQTIGMLEEEEEQEQVLSQWLHHFMYCPSSDWPNLQTSYTRWCAASRKLFTSREQ
ncbi:hypothetical protein MLD38_032169 [Melastoma candidum]|uniref:Uncharacterized protein n=1 Tax=Melastoma candidum TaxID=119954 RepID=A0ACB9M3F9_9MYRT|nr:hypothetical protein MLD38_032169 [Melastoma candidum]